LIPSPLPLYQPPHIQVKEEGYEVAHDGLLVTVFSAPNYCDQMGNKGAFVRFNGNDMVPHFTTFEVRGGRGRRGLCVVCRPKVRGFVERQLVS
jgi:hypothetical protein